MRGAVVALVLTLVSCGEDDGDSVVVVPVLDAGRDGGAEVGPAFPDDTGAPSCGYPQVLCAGRCLDVSGDPMNCGGCNAMCPSGYTCTVGLCVAPPTPTQ